MKALIVGGGIGGTAAAMALQRVNIDVTVYEAYEAPAEFRGLFLDLAVNGLRVLQQLDALDAVRAVDIVPTPDLEFMSTTGRTLGRISMGWLDENTPSFTVMRGALQRALAQEAERRGIPLVYGKRLESYEVDDSGVVARFADGSEARGDVLIGADGIHSAVRRKMLPDGPVPSFTGLLNIGGVAHGTSEAETAGVMRMIWGKRAFFGYTVRPSGDAWWFANLGSRKEPQRQELADVSSSEWRRRLLATFADDPAPVRHLIESTEHIDGWTIHDMPSLPTWHRARVALLGDAAHAVSPSAGQGASLALEDALVLANCLRDAPSAATAFERYESLRRPRAEKVVAAGRRRGEYKALDNRAALFMRDLLMPVALRLFARESTMSWLHDYHVPWDEARPGPKEFR